MNQGLSEARKRAWRRTRQQKAIASGEPLVIGLPDDFAGQVTVTVKGCWRWHGQRRTDGRPLYLTQYVYRLLFVALRGPLKPSDILHHAECHQYWCANPWHTEPLTQSVHMKRHGFGGDGAGHAGKQSQKTRCPAGHPYDEENTVRISGERRCRECLRASGRRTYYANLEHNRRKAREREQRKRERIGTSAGTAELPTVFVPLRRPRRWERD
jgi:hypothetical protein